MRVRAWVRAIHRDVGYFLVGLTVIYSVSGIAVNHVADWNPNYVIEETVTPLSLSDEEKQSTSSIVQAVMKQAGGNLKLKESFRPDSTTVKIFTEQEIKIDYDLAREEVTKREVKNRPVFRESNFLHLNAPKKIWTWVADIFAGLLIFLAISGLFMVKGKKGFKWRGAILLVLGILLPVIFLLMYFY